MAVTTITDEILDLKQQCKAMILAHHYQEPEIQELADAVGTGVPRRRHRLLRRLVYGRNG
jgi:quinolinate synthase